MTAAFIVDVLVGPCTEADVEDLMVAIVELPECKKVGGVVACHRDEPEERKG